MAGLRSDTLIVAALVLIAAGCGSSTPTGTPNRYTHHTNDAPDITSV